MPLNDQKGKPCNSGRNSAHQGWFVRGLWRVANYYCPLQEGRFVLDMRTVLQGFPAGIYRNLIPASVMSSLADLAHHGWLLPLLELPSRGLSFLFTALGGLMLGFYLGTRF